MVGEGHHLPPQMLEPPPWSNLHMEILQFAQGIQKEQEPIELEIMAILNELRAIVGARWQGAEADLYGSRSTGLALSSSDMDVVLRGISCPPGAISAALKTLADDLAERTNWIKKQKLVASARIPVLKLQSHSGVPIDITIATNAQHTGLEARNLVCRYLQEIPQIKPLVLVMKTFLRSLSLNDPYTGGISSYCIVVLLHMFCLETFRYNPINASDCGILLLNFLNMFPNRFEKQLTYVEDPLSTPVLAPDGKIIQQSENIMQSCYQISRLCVKFREAHAAINPDSPDIGPWDSYEGSLLARFFGVGPATSSTQTDQSGERPPTTRDEPRTSQTETAATQTEGRLDGVCSGASSEPQSPPSGPPLARATVSAGSGAGAGSAVVAIQVSRSPRSRPVELGEEKLEIKLPSKPPTPPPPPPTPHAPSHHAPSMPPAASAPVQTVTPPVRQATPPIRTATTPPVRVATPSSPAQAATTSLAQPRVVAAHSPTGAAAHSPTGAAAHSLAASAYGEPPSPSPMAVQGLGPASEYVPAAAAVAVEAPVESKQDRRQDAFRSGAASAMPAHGGDDGANAVGAALAARALAQAASEAVSEAVSEAAAAEDGSSS